MCVILVSDRQRLSESLIVRAVRANGHGNGFAWIDDSTVKFEKSITLARAIDLAASVPMPYVFHARIASIGAVHPELCHPFPLDRSRQSRTRLKGSSKSGVLFHNGTWPDHVDFLVPHSGRRVLWSDTLTMATIAVEHGLDELDVVPEWNRLAVLTPKGVRVQGAGWVQLASGIRASNAIGLTAGWRA